MKYLILGAGPAGLTIANYLKQHGELDFMILESENEVGGLCRSREIDGAPLDIGGGHFLDVRRPEVNKFLFQFMPENEWNLFERDSRIQMNDYVINHPIEANLWQMPLEEQISYLKSIAIAGCNVDKEMPMDFVNWIYWKLGKKIADEYMLPYNRKMFGEQLENLGTYWLEKLPNVSFEETLKSCLTRKAYGTQPGHAQFLYPKRYGYGEVWKRMGIALNAQLKCNKRVNEIDFDTRTVITEDGNKYSAQNIITTIPWMELKRLKGMPNDLIKSINNLKYTSVQIEYFSENIDTDAHWIYYPSTEVSYHRILLRHNFCNDSKGYWTETNCDRVDGERQCENYRYVNKYAYPLNTINKPSIMKELLEWAKCHHVYGLGRWGNHQHYNSDTTVELALKLGEELIRRNSSDEL